MTQRSNTGRALWPEATSSQTGSVDDESTSSASDRGVSRETVAVPDQRYQASCGATTNAKYPANQTIGRNDVSEPAMISTTIPSTPTSVTRKISPTRTPGLVRNN